MPLTPKNTDIILAGPGVGKTTELLRRIEEALAKGTDPTEIAFFSFSNTAVNEGLDRITKNKKYTKLQFKYFKTLHAMALHILGFNSKQIMSVGLKFKFAAEANLKLAPVSSFYSARRMPTPDDTLLDNLDSARQRNMSIREYWIANHIDEPSAAYAEQIADMYSKFKIANGVIDFTDMICLANNSEWEPPKFKYMFIDEAQDLSTQQWLFVEKLIKNTKKIVIVGDEKQAIAGYAGADPDYFLNIEGNIHVLDQSYRVPENIYKLARKVEKKMIKTNNVLWKPRPLEQGEIMPGEVIRIRDLPIREMRLGKWLLLTRTNAQLGDFKDFMFRYCDDIAASFTIDGKPPIDTDVFKAIDIFNVMKIDPRASKFDFIEEDSSDNTDRKNKKYTFIKILKKFISSEEPYSTKLDKTFLHRFSYVDWIEAFDKIPYMEKKYIAHILPAYKKNPKLFDNPNIKLSTIHSAKGTEADNVVLYNVLTEQIYNNWLQDKETKDDELKVLFVAITRARKRLYVLTPENRKHTFGDILE